MVRSRRGREVRVFVGMRRVELRALKILALVNVAFVTVVLEGQFGPSVLLIRDSGGSMGYQRCVRGK